MSTARTARRTGRNAVVYWGAIALLVVFTVIALLTFRGARESARAADKADELIAVLQDAGVSSLPSTEQVVRVLGDDGGATCQDPAGALSRATLFAMLTNGAAGPGVRPVVTDSRVLRGQLAVITVYCPDELEDVQAFVEELVTDDVVRG